VDKSSNSNNLRRARVMTTFMWRLSKWKRKWDAAKSDACFERRGFDFAFAARVFSDHFSSQSQLKRDENL
jgi:hypothetical protein